MKYAFLLGLIFFGIFLLVNNVSGEFLYLEDLTVQSASCPKDYESRSFVDGMGNSQNLCLKRTGLVDGKAYVNETHLEIRNANCNLGELKGVFSGAKEERIIVCADSLMSDEGNRFVSDVVIKEGACPAGFAQPGSFQSSAGNEISYCVLNLLIHNQIVDKGNDLDNGFVNEPPLPKDGSKLLLIVIGIVIVLFVLLIILLVRKGHKKRTLMPVVLSF